MKLLITLVAITSMVAGAAHMSHERNSYDVERAGTGTASASRNVAHDVSTSALERLERSAKTKPETMRPLGHFELEDGRRLELFTADTGDGRACLIDHDPRFGASAGCVDGALFRQRKVEFSVRFDGGPERFGELYVSGVVAPGIRSAELTKSDGTAVRLELAESRAFVYESPRSDLESGVYPNGFRLFGPRGKLADTVTFPPPGS